MGACSWLSPATLARANSALGPGDLEFVTAVALLTGCAIVSGHTGGQVLYDATMTAAVKSLLAHAEGLRTLTGIHVRTDHDVIFLTGHVPGRGHRRPDR